MPDKTIRFSANAAKNDIKRFYRHQNYSAKFKGYDQVFFAIQSEKQAIECQSENIIASVIISQLKQDHKQALLHGLVVDNVHRGKKLGTKLINYALKQCSLPVEHIVCFAEPRLAPFYVNCGFAFADNYLAENNVAGKNLVEKNVQTAKLMPTLEPQPIPELTPTITPKLTPELAARFASYQKYQADLTIFIRPLY